MAEQDDLPPLDSLDARIARARNESAAEREKKASEPGSSKALRSGTELIAGVAVGGFLGYQLDEWLGTRPGITIFGIFLGMAGGVMNIYRAVSFESEQQKDEAATAESDNRDSDGM